MLTRYSLLSYSQEGEDMVIRRYLPVHRPGNYVDVGAHHPLRFSNTYALYLCGWRGLNIDARLGMRYRFELVRPGDKNVEAAVGPRSGEMDFHVFEEGALSTLDPALAAERRGLGYKQIAVRRIPVRPLRDILAEHLLPGAGIDLLCVDTEGMDLDVLKSNDWKRFRPGLVVVESLEIDIRKTLQGPLGRAMRGWGYELVAKALYSYVFRRVEKKRTER